MELVTTLEWDRQRTAEVLGLDNDSLNSWAADGRSLSSLVQFRLISALQAKTRYVSGGTQMLVLDGRRYWVRCATKKNGVCFYPAFMKGHGRNYSAQAFLKWLAFDGFLVANIVDWPVVDVFRFETQEILELSVHGEVLPELSYVRFLDMIKTQNVTLPITAKTGTKRLPITSIRPQTKLVAMKAPLKPGFLRSNAPGSHSNGGLWVKVE